MSTIDLSGVPEFFAPKIGHYEDAGHGLVRCVRVITRGNTVIPVYSTIIPAETLVVELGGVREFALRMLGEMRSGARH